MRSQNKASFGSFYTVKILTDRAVVSNGYYAAILEIRMSDVSNLFHALLLRLFFLLDLEFQLQAILSVHLMCCHFQLHQQSAFLVGRKIFEHRCNHDIVNPGFNWIVSSFFSSAVASIFNSLSSCSIISSIVLFFFLIFFRNLWIILDYFLSTLMGCCFLRNFCLKWFFFDCFNFSLLFFT